MKPKNLRVNSNIIIAIILTFLITGGAVFFWQQTIIKNNQKIINQLQKRIIDLQTQLTSYLNWKTFTDAKAGFTLSYPAEIVSLYTGHPDTDFTDTTNSKGIDLSVDSALADKGASQYRDALKEGMTPSKVYDYNRVIKLTNGKLAAEGGAPQPGSTYGICDLRHWLYKNLMFFNGQKIIYLDLSIDYKNYQDVINEMPKYFKRRPECNNEMLLDNAEGFYQTLAKHQGVGIAQKWYDAYDAIIKSITLK